MEELAYKNPFESSREQNTWIVLQLLSVKDVDTAYLASQNKIRKDCRVGMNFQYAKPFVG